MERRITTRNDLTTRLQHTDANLNVRNPNLLDQGVEAAYLFPSIDRSERASLARMPVDEDMWLGGEAYVPHMRNLHKCNYR